MEFFSASWTALRRAVAGLSAEDFTRPSGCTGRLVRDLVCHVIIDAQDVLITLVAYGGGADPGRGTYWAVAATPPAGDDPLDALTVRLAVAYQDPALLLIAHPPGATAPPAESLARTRTMLEEIAGAAFPVTWSDPEALVIGTGRRAQSAAEQTALGDLSAKLPLILG